MEKARQPPIKRTLDGKKKTTQNTMRAKQYVKYDKDLMALKYPYHRVFTIHTHYIANILAQDTLKIGVTSRFYLARSMNSPYASATSSPNPAPKEVHFRIKHEGDSK